MFAHQLVVLPVLAAIVGLGLAGCGADDANADSATSSNGVADAEPLAQSTDAMPAASSEPEASGDAATAATPPDSAPAPVVSSQPPQPVTPYDLAPILAQSDQLERTGDYTNAFQLLADAQSDLTDSEQRRIVRDRLGVLRQLKADSNNARRLIRQLRDGNSHQRRLARRELAGLGEPARFVVAAALVDPNETIEQSELVGMLVRLGDPSVLPQVLELLPSIEPRDADLWAERLIKTLNHLDATDLTTVINAEAAKPDHQGRIALGMILEHSQTDADFLAKIGGAVGQDTILAFVRSAYAGSDEAREWAIQWSALAGLAKPGLHATIWHNTNLDGEPAATAIHERLSFTLDTLPRSQNVGIRWEGQLRITEPGAYTLFIASDDGSRLWLGDEHKIDNWGFHGVEEKSLTVTLEAGDYPLRIDYMQGTGGGEFHFRWSVPGVDGKQVVAADHLFHQPR